MKQVPGLTVMFAAGLACLIGAGDAGAQFVLQQQEDGVMVTVDGKPFTKYLVKSGSKPILWPIIGPTGEPLTRGYPMQKGGQLEHSDHPHHRSFWFAHGDVNGTSFWHEGPQTGTTVHREFVDVEGGATGRIVTRNDWLDSAGKKLCWDERTLGFGASAEYRWIDFDITIHGGNEPVKFGDTKEGTFGIRVAGPLKVDAGKGGKIVNSHGQIDKDTWGKQAPWVDYFGPIQGKTVGVAILNHPSSFRYPTYWHVRTYGLFAANPFGLHNFENSRDVDGAYTLKPDESITMRYRVLLHSGTTEEAKVADVFRQYAETPKGKP